MKRPINQKPKLDAIGRRFDDLPQSTGKRVELTANDIAAFQFYLRHGDLPVPIVFEYLRTLGLVKDLQSTTKRHGQLFHEANTAYGGTYLDRDPNQKLTNNPNYHRRVHRLNHRSKKVLMDEDLFTEHTPKTSSSWKHDFLRACFSASIEIACLREPEKYKYIAHPKIVERIGIDEFSVEGKPLRPDLIHGIRYKSDDSVRLFLVEIDCKTEQVHNTKKNKYRTFESKLDRYRKYIGGGLYKKDFGIGGGVMLQTVTTNQTHMYNLIKLNEKKNYMLFNYVENFDWGFVPPVEIFPLFNEPWLCPGNPDFFINSVEGTHT